MKFGTDLVGIALGLLTIPMAMLCMGSAAAGLMLIVWQDWSLLLFGAAVFLIGAIGAPLLERVVIAVDDAAAVSLGRGQRVAAYAIAIVSGAFPVLVIFTTEITAFRGVSAWPATTPSALHALWAYGVAAAPWSLFAERVSRFRRTLVGIRAYAGHVALWLFVLLSLWLHASPAIVVAVLLVPATLPFTLGLVLALADREAIANVRV